MPLHQIDELIRRHIDEQGVPGASVAIVRDREPLLVQGYGFADIERQTPATPDTTFQIASLTKQFTAMMVLMLAHEGKLHLDDAITKWLPEGGDKWSMISVRHLVAHLSGLNDIAVGDLDFELDYTEDDFVQAIATTPHLRAPGTKWDYCNSNYVLLGALIHRLTGKPWWEAMGERIFAPLGMTSARVIDEVVDFDRAIGYDKPHGELETQEWIAPSHNTVADGGLLMSARDFVGWSAGLDSEIMLPQSVLRDVWQPVRFRDGNVAGSEALRFGLGWMLPVEAGLPRMAQHKGAWMGFSTYIGRLLEEKLTVVVLTNLVDDFSHPDVIGREILMKLV